MELEELERLYLETKSDREIAQYKVEILWAEENRLLNEIIALKNAKPKVVEW